MVGRDQVVVTNEPGSMGSLCTVIGRNQGNISTEDHQPVARFLRALGRYRGQGRAPI